jgi:hypothetical protein
MVSVGEAAQYAGLVVLVQGLMLAGTRRRLEAFPARKIAGLGKGVPASRNGGAAAPVNDQPSAETGLQVVSAGSKAMLLQVAWLAILVGLLLQLACYSQRLESGSLLVFDRWWRRRQGTWAGRCWSARAWRSGG